MSAPTTPSLADRLFGMAQAGIIHAAFEAIVTVDDQQRIVMINPAAQRMFGCTAAEALGSELSRFIPSQHRATHARHVSEFSASDAVELPMGKRGTVFGIRANGEEFPAEASISRVDMADEFGTRRYSTALLHDLSEEQGLKAEIDALQRRMRAIFELAPVAIWITNGDRIVFANEACARLFGAADRAALVGRSIYSLLMPESHQAVRQTVAQALASETTLPLLSERIARLDGTVRDVVIAVAGLPDHGNSAMQMVITDISERTRESQELERSRRELRRLSASLVNAREEEQRRIARELHDELGQRLTALKMQLSSLASLPQRSARDQRVASMLEMVDETVASVRRIATELRPLMLDDLGLVAAIDWLARESARRMGIEVKMRLGDTEPPVSEAAAIALYRMVQEALTNIARHAHATEASIEIRRESDELVVTVQDNGVGFSEESIHRERSHGLMGIRERAYMLGGSLEIGNLPCGGGSIAVRLPLLPAAAGARTYQRGTAHAIGGAAAAAATTEP